MSQLNISLLGPMQVEVEAAPITGFRFDRVRALLAYLSIEGDRPADRSSLALLLWPDDSAKRASENLRQALATLRRALNEKSRTIPFLNTSNSCIQINQQADVFVDLVRFNQLIAEVKGHAHRHVLICSHCLNLLQQAVDLYRNDFLDGLLIDSDLFEDWARERREEAHQQMNNSLAILTEGYIRQGKYELALPLARRQLTLDSLSTHGNHQLIQCLGALGMRNEALRHYLSYQQLLQEELALKPPKRTVELFLDLNADDWHYRIIGERTPHNLPAEITPMVGYRTEMAKLQEKLACREHRLLTVAGPAGSGKSRLATRIGWLELPNFTDGVYFIPCRASQHGTLWHRLDQVLDIAADKINPRSELLAWLKERDILLIFDGFEQLVQEGNELLALLRATTNINLLLTSRVWLGHGCETVIPLFGLPAGEANILAKTEQTDTALSLFTAAVQRHQPTFVEVNNEELLAFSRLCEAVGGLPAALELSASWLRSLSAGELSRRVGHNINSLRPPVSTYAQQHADLGSHFSQDWQKLSAEEQGALRKLACLTGRSDCASSHTEPAILYSLQTKSWLQAQTQPGKGKNGRKMEKTVYRINPLQRLFVQQQAS